MEILLKVYVIEGRDGKYIDFWCHSVEHAKAVAEACEEGVVGYSHYQIMKRVENG